MGVKQCQTTLEGCWMLRGRAALNPGVSGFRVVHPPFCFPATCGPGWSQAGADPNASAHVTNVLLVGEGLLSPGTTCRVLSPWQVLGVLGEPDWLRHG